MALYVVFDHAGISDGHNPYETRRRPGSNRTTMMVTSEGTGIGFFKAWATAWDSDCVNFT